MTEEHQPQETQAQEDQQAPQEEQRAFSQEDVNKIAGNRYSEGQQKVLKDLGFEDLDSLKSTVEAHRKAEEESKTEIQRMQEARDSANEELEGAYAHIAQMRQESALRDALTTAGVNPERIAAALRLADDDKLDVDDKGNVTGVEDAIAAVKESAPEFFGSGSRRAPDASPAGETDASVTEEQFNDMLRRAASPAAD